MKLQDQRVLVTGATAGIGQETAKLFARRGASVVITGRDTQRGAQTVAVIEAEGGRAEFIATDLIWGAFCQGGRVKRRPQPSSWPPLR
jgi:NAD(P)-dependent dehydrogenase (short-subunit alcohol dehydrogenase family)